MEPIMSYLRRRLREVGPATREAIAKECDRSPHLLRKIVYEEDRSSTVNSIEPVLLLLQAVDRGERELPALVANDTKQEKVA